MAAKRRRDEDGDVAVAQLVVRPEAVCGAVLATTRTWRDRCNSLYHIESKTMVNRDSIQLKLGFFDELECAKMLALADVELPGNFVIQSMSCDLAKQTVVLTITRTGGGGGAAGKRAAVAPSRPAPAPTETELLRLRTLFDIKESDAVAVQETLCSVGRCFGGSTDWRLVRCAQRPAMYVLYLRINALEVPYEALRAAARHRGVVDFDNKQLMIKCDKTCSDIE